MSTEQPIEIVPMYKQMLHSMWVMSEWSNDVSKGRKEFVVTVCISLPLPNLERIHFGNKMIKTTISEALHLWKALSSMYFIDIWDKIYTMKPYRYLQLAHLQHAD